MLFKLQVAVGPRKISLLWSVSLLSFREPRRALEIAQGLEANMPLGVDKISIELCRLELAKRDRRGRQQESGDDRESADASEVQRHIGTLESQYDLATAGLGLFEEALDKHGATECVKCLHYRLPVLLLKTQETHDRNAGRTCTSAANYCAERGKNGRVRSPQAG